MLRRRQGFVFAIIAIAAIASRPIEARLWRAGRLSDRATAILFLGRFPVLCFLFGLMASGSHGATQVSQSNTYRSNTISAQGKGGPNELDIVLGANRFGNSYELVRLSQNGKR